MKETALPLSSSLTSILTSVGFSSSGSSSICKSYVSTGSSGLALISISGSLRDSGRKPRTIFGLALPDCEP